MQSNTDPIRFGLGGDDARASPRGAMRDVDADATAFANRHQNALVIATVFSPQESTRLDQLWAPLIPAFTGAYTNFETKPTPETTRRAFPPAALGRILQVKQPYDPDSTFRSWPI
jgi:hypothetical protein